MKLLVTTPRHVLLYDGATRRCDVVTTGDGYYGLSWSPDGSTLALGVGGYHAAMNSLEDYAMSDNGYLAVGDRASSRFLSAPHQVLWVDDQGIAVANTGRNAIARVAVSDLSVAQARYDAAVWDRFDRSGAAGCHYNSLHFHGGHLYAVAHNFGRESFIVKARWPSLELVDRVPVTGTTGLHNLWIDDAGRWLTCFSEQGALIDARSGAWLWDCRGEGYTRGLAATDDFIVVGHSDIADRDQREVTRSGVWVIDRRTMKLETFVFLGHFGSVHEVRVVDERDACHPRVPLADSALEVYANQSTSIAESLKRRASAGVPDPSDWERRLGPFVVEEGEFAARDGQLALMTRRRSESFSNGTVSARLHVRRAGVRDHAALVARYGGPADQRQYAAIFQANGSGALTAALWIEDGGWRSLTQVLIPNPLLEGLDVRKDGIPIELVAAGDAFRIVVNGHDVIQVRDGSLTQGAVGVRMLGSSYALSRFQWKPA